MKFRQILKRLAPTYVREYLANLQGRIHRLETQTQHIEDMESRIAVLEAEFDHVVRSPRDWVAPGTGFNGQLRRKEILAELLAAFPFDRFVETGTWLGSTTGYVAATSQLPVFSAELNHRFYSVARARLAGLPGVTLRHADSRRFLSDLAADREMTAGHTLFYLDAHWHSDLPLAEEIELIAASWDEFVIIVDDFEVPGDAGYGYDDFGEGKALTIEYIAEVVSRRELVAYVPSAASEDETGSKRGSVILVRRGASSAKADNIPSLRPA